VPFVRQLLAETLVAVVETLRTLALLYRVNADVEVPALDVVLIELRQLPETIELALDPTGRPLRTEFGETARSDRKSASSVQSPAGWGLREALLYVSRCLLGARASLLVDTGIRARRPRAQSSTGAVGAAGGGAFSPMIRLVTLLAVADIGRSAAGEVSSTGETRPSTGALLLPKLSFHFDGFLVIGAGAVDGMGAEILGSGGTGGTARGELSRETGIAYIETGSNGRPLALVFEDRVVVDLIDEAREAAREARLISRARDCEATASVSSVSSFGVVGGCEEPLPLRAPRLRRLLVDAERDSVPTSLSRPSLSLSWNSRYSRSSSCSSTSWSMTVDSSDASGFSYVVSYAGPKDPARDSDRDWTAGVRIVDVVPEACLEEGR